MALVELAAGVYELYRVFLWSHAKINFLISDLSCVVISPSKCLTSRKRFCLHAEHGVPQMRFSHVSDEFPSSEASNHRVAGSEVTHLCTIRVPGSTPRYYVYIHFFLLHIDMFPTLVLTLELTQK